MKTRPSMGPRFSLPTRIRSTVESADSFTPRLQLADRIAGLPGIAVIDSDGDKGPFVVKLLLATPGGSPGARAEQRPFAEISRDGIAVYGLRSWDKHQLLSRGWGRLQKHNVLLFLPRDERELDICWSIIQRAYESLTDLSAVRSARARFLADLPRPVRPSLQ